MKLPTVFTRHPRIPSHSIEALESRIAPANVTLQSGTGPFFLELSQTTGTLVIVDGSASVIFDQGTTVGDDLFVTGGGAADQFFIVDTAAGHPSFTGILDLNVDCRVFANATLTANQIHLAAAATLQLGGTISSVADSSFSAQAGINVAANATISSTTSDVVFHSDDDGNSDGPILIGTGASITVSGAGNIFLDGNGPGFPAYGDASFSSGILLNGTLTSDTGNISLDGHGWDGGTGAQHGIGVELNGGTITSNTGNFFITGVGGNSTATGNVGVQANAATITTLAGGPIGVSGTGGGTGTGEMGVFMTGGSTIHAVVPALVSVTANGSPAADGTLADNIGLSLESGSSITNTGTATTTIHAQAGASSAALAMATGGGAGTNRIGFDGTTGYNGDLFLFLNEDAATGADPLQLTAGIIASTGALNLGPANDTTSIGIAGGTGIFNVSLADLSHFTLPGFSSITFGAQSGNGHNAFDVGAFDFGGAAISFNAPGGGSIILEGTVTSSGNQVGLHMGAGSVEFKSGTFTETAANLIDNPTAVLVDPGATLDLNGNNQTIGALAGGGNVLLSAASLTIGGSSTTTFGGKLMGSGGLTLNGAIVLTLTGQNTYAGDTHLDNTATLIMGASNVLSPASAFFLGEGVLALGSTNQTVAALTVDTGDITGSGTMTCTGAITTDFANINVKLAGGTGLTKNGIGNTVLANSHNSFTGPVTINGGTLEVHSNGALGNLTNDVIINNATLVTKGSFSTSRNIVTNGAAPTVDIVSGTFTINGTVTGTGTLVKTGTGTLLFGSTFTGAATVATGFVTVAGTKVGITGTGNVTVTVVSNGMGGTRISTVELADTDATTILAISGPKAPATTTIDTIKSLDPNDEIGTIKLGKTVIIGSGINDAIADVDIHGKVDKLLFNDVNSYTLFELGKGLPYNNIADDTTPDSYNNHPDIKLRTVLGTGVVIDVTGDGVTPGDMGGIGGGGLGKVIVDKWDQPGLVKTTQSIGQFKFKHGDCNVVFEVDKDSLGTLTTAGIGKMLVPNGAWGSSGSIVEGNVTVFSAGQFLAAANITAGSMTKLLVKKGSYLGTTTLKNPDAPALGTFSVNGDYQGYVDSAQAIINLNIKGTFEGSLKAKSIGSISAYSFNGTTTGDGEGDPLRHNIFVTDGSLGTIKTSAGGIKDFEIAVATVFNGFNIQWPLAPSGAVGINNVTVGAGQINNLTVNLDLGVADPASFGIKDSIFESAGSIGAITSSHTVSGSIFAATTTMGNALIKSDLVGSKLLAGTSLGGDGTFNGNEAYTREGKIGNVTVQGAFGTTTIAVGVDPGAGYIYGDGDDVAAPGFATPKALGALIFGAASGGIFGPSGMIHTDAIEAATIKSLKVGAAPMLKNFAASHYIRAGGSEVASDVLVQIV